jgi:hypothetical protein
MFTNLLFVILTSLVTVTTCAALSARAQPSERSPLVAQAPEAGMMAIATPGSTRVRVLYVRGGSMVLLRELRLRAGDTVTGVALSADGDDLVIDTARSAYMMSTREWSQQPLQVVAIGQTERASPAVLTTR